MLSLAANDPNRLTICTADSSGAPTLPSPACGGGWGGGCGGVGSSMRGTAWGTRCVLRGRSCCRDGVAPNEKLRRDCGRNGCRRLIANFRETDRADQTGDVIVGKADLAQSPSKA